MICLTNLDLNQNELQNAILQPLATAPLNPKLGQIYTDSSADPKRIKWYDGTGWKLVGVVYEKNSVEGKVLSGLGSNGTVTTVDVKDLKLIGYTPVEGGYVSTGDSIETAIKTLDQAVKNAVSGSGEVNQYAFSNIKISDVTVASTGKTDTVELVSGNMITISADPSTKKITISTNISEATSSKAGLMPTSAVSKLAGIESGAQVNVKPDWSAVANSTSEILNKPTKLSQFTNDEGFIDNTVNNLVNYHTKSEINSLIGNLSTISVSVVTNLPTPGSENVIYLKLKEGSPSGTNIYDEYLWTNSKYELIGDTSLDLSNYLTVTGNASKTTVTFTPAASRTALASGEALDVLLGKVSKYLTDLKTVAFTGNYSDLAGRPNTIKSSTFTITPSQTSNSITVTGTQVVNVTVVDTVNKEVVLCDVDIDGATVTVSVASNPTNALQVIVAYY